MARVEALNTQRQTVDAGSAESCEFFCLNRAGIGLQRDFGIGHYRQERADGREQFIERLPGQQAGRTTAEEDARHLAPPDQRQGGFEIGSGMPSSRTAWELKSQ